MSKELQQVRRAASKAALAHQGLEQAMLQAKMVGLSLRAIAEAAGVSHEQVRRLLSSSSLNS